MREEQRFTAQSPARLDRFVSEASGLTRSQAQRLIREGAVTVNGACVRAAHALAPGDEVRLLPPEPVEIEARPEPMPLDIVYEDADICVINKPQGLVVHPAPGHAAGTLVNGLLYHFGTLSEVGGALRPGIVHRIDRMTSGLLVVAKNDAAHLSLTAQFQTHEAGRAYLALVDGNLREDSGTVDAPIGRHPRERKRMAVVPDGRSAVTHWRVLARFGTHTLLSVALETGRTHQIRVHMASIGHPLAGDAVYGPRNCIKSLNGQCLHAKELGFIHPTTQQWVQFDSPLPAYFTEFLTRLRKEHRA